MNLPSLKARIKARTNSGRCGITLQVSELQELIETLEQVKIHESENTIPVQFAPDWSIIKLPDGKLMVKGRGGPRGKKYVHYTPGHGAAIANDTEVRVVAYPADCAFTILKFLEAICAR